MEILNLEKERWELIDKGNKSAKVNNPHFLLFAVEIVFAFVLLVHLIMILIFFFFI